MRTTPFLKKLFFALGVLVMLIVLSIFFLFISSLKKPSEPIPKEKPVTQVDITTTLVVATDPPVTKQLQSGATQTFTVTLDPSVNASEVKVIVFTSPPSDASAKTAIPTTTSLRNQQISTTTTTPIEPHNTYTLLLLYKGRTILSQAYLSTPPASTPITTNNTSLSSLLPYETLGYILTYNRERDVYEMHFKYVPNSPKDMTSQFEEAKTNTNNFISGSGIDLKTVIIEYLYK